MAEKKTDVEILLESVEIDVKALADSGGKRLFRCELVWPRVGTASRSASLPVELEKGKWSAEGRLLLERIVMRDSIQGRIGLVAGLTGKVSDTLASYFARTTGASAVKLAAEIAGDLLPGMGGDFLAAPLAALSKTVAKEPETDFAFRAAVDFDASSLPANGGTLRLELPLVAARDISKSVRRTMPKGPSASSVRRLVAKGAAVGRCTLSLRAL